MVHSRFLFAAAASVLALAGCKKDDVEPTDTAPKALLAHEWRLTETRLNGQITGSGSLVKDQYDWHFQNGGGYHLTYVADGSMVQGQWQLNNSNLQIVDHKGAPHTYNVQQLDGSTLKLRWEERAGETHEDTYTAR